MSLTLSSRVNNLVRARTGRAVVGRRQLVVVAFVQTQTQTKTAVAPVAAPKFDVSTYMKEREQRNKALIEADEAASASYPEVTLRLVSKVGLGDCWRVVGSSPELGRWLPEVAPSMKWETGDIWTAKLRLRPGNHWFKLVLRTASGSFVFEEGSDRTLELEQGGKPEEMELKVELPQP